MNLSKFLFKKDVHKRVRMLPSNSCLCADFSSSGTLYINNDCSLMFYEARSKKSKNNHKTKPFIFSGFDGLACAGMFVKLMKRLGHDKYYVQGGDWGAYITTIMARLYSK